MEGLGWSGQNRKWKPLVEWKRHQEQDQSFQVSINSTLELNATTTNKVQKYVDLESFLSLFLIRFGGLWFFSSIFLLYISLKEIHICELTFFFYSLQFHYETIWVWWDFLSRKGMSAFFCGQISIHLLTGRIHSSFCLQRKIN